MQNQVQIFESKEFGKVRVVEQGGQPWWVLRDVCKALGLRSANNVAVRLDEDEKGVIQINTPGGKQNTTVISESGLYAVILRSDKSQARAFRKWITSTVIPSIRKHGAYISADTLEQMRGSNEFTEELLDRLSAEHAKNGALMDYVDKLQPKAQYYDAILQSPHAMPVSVIAKDYGMSAFAFNKLLHELGVQYKTGGTWLLYKEYVNKGYTISKTYLVDGKKVCVHTCWTQAGRRFLYDLLAWYDIYPSVETIVEMAV